MVENQKSFAKGMLWIQTIATIAALILIWFITEYKGYKLTTNIKIFFIIAVIIALIFEWYRYFHQKKNPEEENKVLTAFNKFEGIQMKIYAIAYFLGGIIFTLGGIYWIFQGKDLWYLGFLLILAGIISLYLATKYFWWRSQTLSEGRYY